ncbi:Kelch-motif containing protein, partial [Planoprotostelium fungivorum]
MEQALGSLTLSLDQVKKAFEEERQNISEERTRLLREKKEWEEIAVRLHQAQPARTVRLNVGGMEFLTSPATLSSVKGSFFEAMMSGRWPLNCMDNGAIFIDRDPQVFRHILNFLRGDTIPLDSLSPSDLESLISDADFYNLPGLTTAVRSVAEIKTIVKSRKIFLLGGVNYKRSGQLDQVERYDTQTNRWEPMKSMPAALSRFGATAAGGKLWVFGGASSFVYDPEENEWSKISSMIHPRSGFAVVSCDRFIYIIGGFTGLGTSSEMSPMSSSRKHLGACVMENWIYAVGGNSGAFKQSLNLVERYDIVNDRWHQVDSIHTARQDCSVVNIEGHIWVIGGSETTTKDVIEVYDPKMNQWTSLASPCPFPAVPTPCIAQVDGSLFFLGGAREAGRWDVGRNHYEPIFPMLIGRQNAAVAV